MIDAPEPGARVEAIRDAMRVLLAGRRLRRRDAARAIGVAEGEVVASRVGQGVVRLDADGCRLLQRVATVG